MDTADWPPESAHGIGRKWVAMEMRQLQATRSVNVPPKPVLTFSGDARRGAFTLLGSERMPWLVFEADAAYAAAPNTNRSTELRCLERPVASCHHLWFLASSVFPERREELLAEIFNGCTQQRLVPHCRH